MSWKGSRGSRTWSESMRRLLFGLIGATALIAGIAFNSVAAVAAGSAQNATPPSIAILQTAVISTDVLNGLIHGNNLGPTPESTSVEVGLTLANPHAAEQNAAYRAIYDPKSPLYHHFMTAAQVATDFGVPNSTFDSLKAWATRDGLQVAFALTRTSTCS